MSHFSSTGSSGSNKSRRLAVEAFEKVADGDRRTTFAKSSDRTLFWNIAEVPELVVTDDNNLVLSPSIIGVGSHLRDQSSSQRESALALAFVNESTHSHAHASSEEDVHISLGIQSGIERVWHAALERVGSLSLAWQAEGLQTHGSTISAVDPSLVFEGSLAQKHMPTSENVPNSQHHIRRWPRRSRAVVRPRSTTHMSNGSSNNTVRSDEQAPMRQQELDGRREAMLQSMAQEGGFSDHVAETRRLKDRRATMSRNHRALRRAERLRRPPMLNLLVDESSAPLANVTVQVQAPSMQPDSSEGDTSARRRSKRRPRTSIRLERLLPPKTPNSPNKIQTLLSPRNFATNSMVATLTGSPLNRRNHIPIHTARKYSDNGFRASAGIFSAANGLQTLSHSPATHRRAKSLPNVSEAYETTKLQNAKGAFRSKRGGTLVCASEVQNVSSGIRSNIGQSDLCLSSLEDQVSGMFTELGLKSPYVEVSRVSSNDHVHQSSQTRGNVNRYVDTNSSRGDNDNCSSKHPDYHEMEPIPWFYQTQYAIESMDRNAIERDVLLVDDDSSCADYADSVQDHQNQHYAAKFSSTIDNNGGGGSRHACGLGLNSNQRFTGTSGLSTANGSIASTAFDHGQQHRSLFSPHTYSSRLSGASEYGTMPYGCRSCSDQKQPCSQMHNILARIEQTDQYIYNISRNASAVDSLLVDLRSQSRALAESLSISQTRATALGHTVAQTTSFAIPVTAVSAPTVSSKCAESVVSVGSSHGNSNSLREYHLLSRKAHDLHKRHAQMLDTQHFASDSDYELKSTHHNTSRNTSIRDPSQSPRYTAAMNKSSRKSKRSDSSRQRRPEQPIPVRMQRIDKQWSELRAIITQLGLESTGGDSIAPDTAAVSKATTEGLKLIQRVLKTTLETLNTTQAKAALESVEQQQP